MNVPYEILFKIFEYLRCHQLWKLQYINKTIGQKMREYEWNQTFHFKKNITSNIVCDVMTKWNIKNVDLSGYINIMSNDLQNKFKNIRKLNMSYGDVSIVESLGKCINLEELNICESILSNSDEDFEIQEKFDETFFENIGTLNKLKKLCLGEISNDVLAKEQIDNLFKLTGLTHLKAKYLPFSVQEMNKLINLKELRVDWIGNCDDDIMMINLTKLDLRPSLTLDTSREEKIQNLINLKSLTLRDCRITGNSINKLTKLKKLKLIRCILCNNVFSKIGFVNYLILDACKKCNDYSDDVKYLSSCKEIKISKNILSSENITYLHKCGVKLKYV